MKRLALTFMLIGAACPARAQLVVLDHSLRLSYDTWKSSQPGLQASVGETSTFATYNLQAQMPVWDYGLGTFTIASVVDYHRELGEGASPSTLNLSSYNLQAHLFPYQNFHLNLNYVHAQSPALFGGQRIQADVYGLNWIYQGRQVQDLRFTVIHGLTHGLEASEGWTTWTLAGNQNYRTVAFVYELQHEDFRQGNGVQGLQSTSLFSTLDTRLSGAWQVRAYVRGVDDFGSRGFNANTSLIGKVGGWLSMSNLSMNGTTGQTFRSDSLMAAQSFSRTSAQWTTFLSANGSSTQVSPGGRDSTESLTVGESLVLSKNWRVNGDLSLTESSVQNPEGGNDRGSGLSFHAGVTRGGDLPAVLQHSLFYLSDRAFEKRMRVDYPPDYVPAELAQQIFQRRLRHSGQIGFAVDLSHAQLGEGSRNDGLHLSGSLSLNSNLNLALQGSAENNKGPAQLGGWSRTRMVTANLAQSFSSSSLYCLGGYTRTEQAMPAETNLGDGGGPTTLQNLFHSGASRYYTLGYNGESFAIPYGVNLSRYNDSTGFTTDSLSTNATVTLRQLSARISVSASRRSDGLRYQHVTVELLRLFDTISFWGF